MSEGSKPKPPCTFSGINLVGYDVKRDEDTPAMVVDIAAVREKFKQYRLYTQGYRGLGVFIFFAVWYLTVISEQNHEPSTGQANSGIRDFFGKAKADLKVKDTTSAWKFFSTVIIPALHGVDWDSQRNNRYHEDENTGGKAFEFFYNIGGVAITAVKSDSHKCFRGQPCYSLRPRIDDFYEITLADGKTFKVPYNEYMGGYTVGLPSSTTPENLQELLTGYTALMGPDTRQIHLDAILFNPSGRKTISSVRISVEVSVHYVVTMSITLETIPYHLYSKNSLAKAVQIFSQILMIIFSLIVFVKPFVQAKFCEPHFDPVIDNDKIIYEQSLIRLDWLSQWNHLPVSRSGELLWMAPAILIGSINVAVIAWIYLIWCYSGVGEIGANHLDPLFEDPLAPFADADLVTKMTVALERLSAKGFPLMEQERHITNTFYWYFMLQTFIVVMMMVRFLEYLTFQKRLSMVTDTFADIFDEFFHIASVLCAICFTLGVMASLSFGSLDPSFRNFLTSFIEMIELTFGMFKPAATVPINPPLFKYVPHTVIGNEYMNWMPYAIVLIFKVLVTLLLFKLLMGVIMEAYKKKSRLKSNSQSVFAELHEVWRINKYYYWEHKVKGQPFVSFEHLVIAVSNMKNHEKKPWAARFIGFGTGVDSVVRALNNVLCTDPDDYSRPRLKAVVEHHGFQRCGEDEALYCMRVFGKNRDIAKYEFRDWILTTETEKVEKQLKKAAKKYEQAEEHQNRAFQQAHALLHEVANDLAAIEGRDMLITELKREKIGPEEFDMVFDAYDFYQTQQVDSRFMDCALYSLGYSLPKKVLGKLLMKYDADENHCFDKSEFQKLLKDKLLLGRRDVLRRQKTVEVNRTRQSMAKVGVALEVVKAFRSGGKMPKMDTALVMQVAKLAKKHKRPQVDPLTEALHEDEDADTNHVLELPPTA